MVFNATFNNISAISWWSVLLVEETRVPVIFDGLYFNFKITFNHANYLNTMKIVVKKYSTKNWRIKYKPCKLNIFKPNTYLFKARRGHASYIVVVSFIGGGNQSTRRKPPTCHKLPNYHKIMTTSGLEQICIRFKDAQFTWFIFDPSVFRKTITWKQSWVQIWSQKIKGIIIVQIWSQKIKGIIIVQIWSQELIFIQF
jgi:hypothetical protein